MTPTHCVQQYALDNATEAPPASSGKIPHAEEIQKHNYRTNGGPDEIRTRDLRLDRPPGTPDSPTGPCFSINSTPSVTLGKIQPTPHILPGLHSIASRIVIWTSCCHPAHTVHVLAPIQHSP